MRHTVQRQTIAHYLTTHRGHYTAQEIWKKIQKRFPHISLGTVYRNLHILTENKKIREIRAPDQQSYFDGTQKPHHHFICNACERIYDVPDSTAVHNAIEKTMKNSKAGKAESYTLTYHGTCNTCGYESNIKIKRYKKI